MDYMPEKSSFEIGDMSEYRNAEILLGTLQALNRGCYHVLYHLDIVLHFPNFWLRTSFWPIINPHPWYTNHRVGIVDQRFVFSLLMVYLANYQLQGSGAVRADSTIFQKTAQQIPPFCWGNLSGNRVWRAANTQYGRGQETTFRSLSRWNRHFWLSFPVNEETCTFRPSEALFPAASR